jgi:hypothetical protein
MKIYSKFQKILDTAQCGKLAANISQAPHRPLDSPSRSILPVFSYLCLELQSIIRVNLGDVFEISGDAILGNSCKRRHEKRGCAN